MHGWVKVWIDEQMGRWMGACVRVLQCEGVRVASVLPQFCQITALQQGFMYLAPTHSPAQPHGTGFVPQGTSSQTLTCWPSLHVCAGLHLSQVIS